MPRLFGSSRPLPESSRFDQNDQGRPLRRRPRGRRRASTRCAASSHIGDGFRNLSATRPGTRNQLLAVSGHARVARRRRPTRAPAPHRESRKPATNKASALAKRLLDHIDMTTSTTHTLVVHQMRADNCFTYLIADSDTREAALVDPRADRVLDYVRELEERGLRLRLVIETHTHADHLSGAAELRARTGAEIALSGQARSKVATRGLRDGDHLTLGDQKIAVLASPGHTDDSVSLLVDGTILTGDALLIGGAGRTDFQHGSPVALYETLHKRLAALPGELSVYSAHV